MRVSSTPWGPADSCTTHADGVYTVSTASHGGIMFTLAAAEKHLSPAARRHGMRFNGYLCYEEDCAASIPRLDAKGIRDKLLADMRFYALKTSQEIEEHLISDLSLWIADYLLEVGITPSEPEYAIYRARREADALREAKSPNLIVCASGSWKTLVPGVVEVTTADGQSHYVTEESYEARFEDDIRSILNPLDACILVPENSLPPLEKRLPLYAVAIQTQYVKEIESNSKDSIAEKQGNFYGPRRRFSGTLNSALESLASALREELDITHDEATDMAFAQLPAIREAVHPELRDCPIFLKSSIAA